MDALLGIHEEYDFTLCKWVAVMEDVQPMNDVPTYYCATGFRYDLCCQQQCRYCVHMEEPDTGIVTMAEVLASLRVLERHRPEPKSRTASAVLALIEENERRFKERLKRIKLAFGLSRGHTKISTSSFNDWSHPEHPDYLRSFEYPQGVPDYIRAVPRSRALVRLQDCPVFVMWVQCDIRGMNYSAIDPTALLWIFDRSPIYMKVKEWWGTYGSEGR